MGAKKNANGNSGIVDLNISPAANKLAEENGIDVTTIKGSGRNGAILVSDIQALIDAKDKANDRDELEAARKEVEAEYAKKAKENKTAKGREAKRLADAKAAKDKAKADAERAKEEAKKKAEEERAKRKAEKEAERERKRQEREAEAARKAEEQAKKDAEAFNQFKKVGAEARTVRLSEVAPWDTAGAESNASKSIAHLGAVTAVTLRELPEDSDEYRQGFRYAVIDGSRRLSDYAEQGIQEFPATVVPREADEATLAAIQALTNMARSGNIIHEAESLKAVMDSTDWQMKDVAAYFGLPLPTVSKTLKVLQVPRDFYEAIRKGIITASVAMELANLSPEQQDKARKILEETGTIKIKDVRDIRRADKEEQLSKVDGEAFESGEGQYKEISKEPEVVLENAVFTLLKAGLSVDDIHSIVDKVAEDMKEEAEAEA